jgi:hypothetical protein
MRPYAGLSSTTSTFGSCGCGWRLRRRGRCRRPSKVQTVLELKGTSHPLDQPLERLIYLRAAAKTQAAAVLALKHRVAVVEVLLGRVQSEAQHSRVDPTLVDLTQPPFRVSWTQGLRDLPQACDSASSFGRFCTALQSPSPTALTRGHGRERRSSRTKARLPWPGVRFSPARCVRFSSGVDRSVPS